MTTIDCVNKVIDFVESELDLEPKQVMLADSICSDDVNSIQYPARTQEFLGYFQDGRIGWIPIYWTYGDGCICQSCS
jgi:hypothetical protein